MILVAAALQVLNIAFVYKTMDQEVGWMIALLFVAMVVQIMIFTLLAGDVEHAEIVTPEEWDAFVEWMEQKESEGFPVDDPDAEDQVVREEQ